jgi:hypothetical protein
VQRAARLREDGEAGRVGPPVAGRRVGRAAAATDGDDERGDRQAAEREQEQQDEHST